MRVLLDVDGVLANSNAAFLAALHDVTRKRFAVDQVTDWSYQRCLGISAAEEQAAWETVGLRYWDFVPYPGAIDAVGELRADGHEVVFVTAPSPHVPDWVYFRDIWLTKHFGSGSAGSVPVVHTSHKYLVQGDAMVDDKWSNLAGWIRGAPGRVGVLWAQPWNEGQALAGNICRSGDWNILRSFLRQEAKARPGALDRAAYARAP